MESVVESREEMLIDEEDSDEEETMEEAKKGSGGNGKGKRARGHSEQEGKILFQTIEKIITNTRKMGNMRAEKIL